MPATSAQTSAETSNETSAAMLLNPSSSVDETMRAWHGRWMFMPNPAPGILGMVPINLTPMRDGSQQNKPSRPGMVIWLMAHANGLVSMNSAAGDCAGSWENALAHQGTVLVLHNKENMVTLVTTMGRLPPPGMDFVSTMSRELSKAIKDASRAMLTLFRLLLLPEAMKAAQVALRSRTAGITVNAYNTFVGAGAHPSSGEIETGVASGTGVAGEWRRQVVERWPLLASSLASYSSVVEACDLGQSVPVAAANALGISQATLRVLSGAPFGTSGNKAAWPHNALRGIRLADALPVSMLPRNTVEWTRCLELSGFLHRLIGNSDHMKFLETPLDNFSGGKPHRTWTTPSPEAKTWLTSLMRRSGAPWAFNPSSPAAQPAQAAREAEHAEESEDAEEEGELSRDEMGMYHAQDACSAFALEVLMPIAWAQPDYPTSVRGMPSSFFLLMVGALALMSQRSLHSFLMICWRHLEWSRLPDILGEVPLDDFMAPVTEGAMKSTRGRWMPLADDATSPQGWTVRNLASQTALNNESLHMHHCVRTYGWMSMEGASSILSLISPEGSRSTAEIRMQPPGNKTKPLTARLTCNQHKGRKNRKLPQGAATALAWYLHAMSDGTIEANTERLELMSSNQGKHSYGVNGADQYFVDIENVRNEQMEALKDPENRRLAWKRWQRWIGAREATPEEWLVTLPVEINRLMVWETCDFKPYANCTGAC